MPVTITEWFLGIKINSCTWKMYSLCREDKSSCRILVGKSLRKWPLEKQRGWADNGKRM
jgi:hypothetical protein